MKRYFSYLTLCIVMTVIAAIVMHAGLLPSNPPPAEAAKSQKPGVISEKFETSAISGVLMDINGNVLFEKDKHKQLPPASVTKVMTLLLAVEALDQGKVKLSDEVMTTEKAWRQGGSQIWLEPGEKMTFDELLIAVATASANDAAVAVAEHVAGSQEAFIELMNQKVKELGLQDTHFTNVNGLPASGHYMSAYDTAQIVRYALRYPKYMELVQIKEHWLRGGKTWLVNTNKLLWWYQGADGFKTGWTEEAKYCLASTAVRNNFRLINVVFGTPEPRSHFREAIKLFDWGFAKFEGVSVIDKGALVQRIRVKKGTEKEIPVIAKEALHLTIPKGNPKNIQQKILLDPKVNAPIIQGQKLGELVVLKDNQQIASVDLVAGQSVEKASILQMFREIVTDLVTVAK